MRLVIGEDAVLFREGLIRLVEDCGYDVVGKAGDATSLVEAVRASRPDVAIIDVRMPPDLTDDWARAAARLRAELPDLGILCSPSTSNPDTVSLSSPRVISAICSRTGFWMCRTSWTHSAGSRQAARPSTRMWSPA